MYPTPALAQRPESLLVYIVKNRFFWTCNHSSKKKGAYYTVVTLSMETFVSIKATDIIKKIEEVTYGEIVEW